MPPVVTGYMLLLLFGRRGFFGELLANIGNPLLAVGAAFAQDRGNAAVGVWFQITERQIFQLPLQEP